MATYQESTGRSISEAFGLFHSANPQVYKEFTKIVHNTLAKGKKKMSAKLIINLIRWEKYLETEDATVINIQGQKVSFRINDAYSAHYARLFLRENEGHPDLKEIFNLRELRS